MFAPIVIRSPRPRLFAFHAVPLPVTLVEPFATVNDVHVILGTEKLVQYAEATINLRGKTLFAKAMAYVELQYAALKAGLATVSVDIGGVLVGSAHPVVVQSMTNTDTADADATVRVRLFQ